MTNAEKMVTYVQYKVREDGLKEVNYLEGPA